jgi:DNA polymerase alpha-associated DNA helicase A
LQLEREEEEEQTRLLNSNCSPKLLEQRGLALGGLGVSSISIGLGGKTYVCIMIAMLTSHSLIELNRPLAYHVSTALPPHTFRNGDPVRIEEHIGGGAGKKGAAKKKDKGEDEQAVEGIVYRVGPEKIVVAVSEGKDVDLPERLRL